jgi:hypothetical protein
MLASVGFQQDAGAGQHPGGRRASRDELAKTLPFGLREFDNVLPVMAASPEKSSSQDRAARSKSQLSLTEEYHWTSYILARTLPIYLG